MLSVSSRAVVDARALPSVPRGLDATRGITLHFVTLHYIIPSHPSRPGRDAWHCIIFHHIALHHPIASLEAWTRRVALHYISSHCITLSHHTPRGLDATRGIILYFITLHYIIPSHPSRSGSGGRRRSRAAGACSTRRFAVTCHNIRIGSLLSTSVTATRARRGGESWRVASRLASLHNEK